MIEQPSLSTPPEEPPEGVTRSAPSLVILNTGDGKGKSTAAMGTMLRAVARGWRVGVIQFLKSGDWKVGEEKIARDLGVDWWAVGDGFTWDSSDMDRTQAVAVTGWEFARDAIESGRYDFLVLDEVTYPLNWGWVPLKEFVEVVRGRPEHVTVVITGRDVPAEVTEIADTVTEMRNVRHAFDSGIRARRGIDY